jgi:hypothetical protein
MNDAFLRAIANAENDNHRVALNLTQAQRKFIAERNAQFGRPGYDLRGPAWCHLQTIAFSRRAKR